MTATASTSPADLTEEMQAQSVAYAVLSRVFAREPDADLVTDVAEAQRSEGWPVAASTTPVRTGLALLGGDLADWDAAQLPALRRDYLQLFVGPGHIPAAPWESVYRSKDHLIFEAETHAVRAFYRRHGLKAPNNDREPDDHLALELAFMLHLCTGAAHALQAHEEARARELLEAQREFLNAHLLRWAPACLERVITHARTGFYRGFGHLALGTLAHAARELELAPPSTG